MSPNRPRTLHVPKRASQLEREELDTAPPGADRGREPRHNNQERLGVNKEHKTETMRRRHRGTFP